MRELLGQPRLLERLGRQLTSGEASHAYLISGPRSIGKHTLALRVAQTLLCSEAPPRPGGCGACLACRKIARGSHPDVREVARLADEDRRDISIEQIREAARDLHLRPIEGGWRVVIVDDAAELSDAAQDSVLKTLEEPPAHAVLALVTASPERLLPTVVSRCQPLPLRPVPAMAIAEFLQQRAGDVERAHAAAAVAGGRPGLALRLLEDEGARSQRLADLDALFELLGRRLLDRFAWAYRAAEEAGRSQEERKALQDRLQRWTELLRDASLPERGPARVHPDRADRTARLGGLVGRAPLLALADLLVKLRDDLGRNANPRTALELLALKLPYLVEFGRAA